MLQAEREYKGGMTQEERNRVLDLLDVINDWRRTGRPDLARILAAIERLEPYLLPTNEGASPPRRG